MNSKIFILLVIGFQLIDASIIKKQDFDITLESNDLAINAAKMIFKYNQTFTFDILKTVKVGDYVGEQIDCQGDKELCERYGFRFVECTNKAYLKADEGDFLCKYSGSKFSNVNVYSQNSMSCSGKFILVDSIFRFVPDQCYLKSIRMKKPGYNPRDDKRN